MNFREKLEERFRAEFEHWSPPTRNDCLRAARIGAREALLLLAEEIAEQAHEKISMVSGDNYRSISKQLRARADELR